MPSSPASLTPELLLSAYAGGYFPMAETRDSEELFWLNPQERGILPLETFHTPRSLARLLRNNAFLVTTNRAFPDVIAACAAWRPGREESWINPTIRTLYTELWKRGHAHSVECWIQDEKGYILAGGLYGVSLAGAFFGESMFSHVSNASKVALASTANRLKEAGYTLFDTQFVNDHLKQFGAKEIPRRDYLKKLGEALQVRPRPCFDKPGQAWPTSEE